MYLKTDQPQKPGKLLAFGNPDLGSARFDLPNAQIEAESVGGDVSRLPGSVAGGSQQVCRGGLGKWFFVSCTLRRMGISIPARR
ncbi:MAG: hypothetical protein WDM77_10635 [Steroidobacteraceae bacterium]